MRNEMILYPTLRCDMRCSFCYVNLNPVEENHQLFMENVEKDIVENGVYNIYSIIGGEPLLIPNVLKDLVRLIRRLDPKNGYICLATNGTHLTEDIVEFINNTENAGIKISTDGTIGGYKNIMHLFDKMPLLKKLDQLSFNVVIEPNTDFAVDLLGLVEIFDLDELTININKHSLNIITDDSICILERNFKLIKEYNEKKSFSFKINGFFNNCCTGRDNMVFWPDGRTETCASNYNLEGMDDNHRGCAHMVNLISEKRFYDKITDIMENFYG